MYCDDGWLPCWQLVTLQQRGLGSAQLHVLPMWPMVTSRNGSYWIPRMTNEKVTRWLMWAEYKIQRKLPIVIEFLCVIGKGPSHRQVNTDIFWGMRSRKKRVGSGHSWGWKDFQDYEVLWCLENCWVPTSWPCSVTEPRIAEKVLMRGSHKEALIGCAWLYSLDFLVWNL